MSCLVVAKLSVAEPAVALFPTWNRGMFKLCDFRTEKACFIRTEMFAFATSLVHIKVYFSLCVVGFKKLIDAPREIVDLVRNDGSSHIPATNPK